VRTVQPEHHLPRAAKLEEFGEYQVDDLSDA
jgi:hypothetical protein